MRTHSPVSGADRAKKYAIDVENGVIRVGPYVRLACRRFIRDLERSKDDDFPYLFDADAANEEIRFIELLPHTKGKWAGKRELIRLEPWQCFIEANIFGWLRKESGKRRFRESYEEVARKNGKSTRLAGRGLYLLAADGETGSEIYSGATSEKQAYEVFRPAWMMAYSTPQLREYYGIELAGNPKNPGTIFITHDMSRFEAIIGKPGDGPSPHAALIDEYHEHDSDHMVDSMKTGMGAREQPLLSVITTAGSNIGGPCYEKRQDVIRILEGQVEDETVFGIIYSLDPEDAWDDPANLTKANPNYGVSVFPEFLEAALAEARRSAAKQNTFRTKHLNEWVGARTAWMNMLAWQRQKRALTIDEFSGCSCWAAVDLASKLDVTALVLLFERDNAFWCIPKFYVPEDALENNPRYRTFATEGTIITTPGNATDYAFIEEDIKSIASRVNLQDVAFDDYQANYLITRLADSSIKVCNYNQTVKNMSEPMKETEARILSRTLWHDGNSAMTWMMGNVVAKIDAKDNIYPRKERENNPSCKIDGPVALIMTIGRALAAKEREPEYQMMFL